MMWFIFILCKLILISVSLQKSTLFGKIDLPQDFLWSNVIFRITNFQSTLMECGTLCLTETHCELYTLNNVTKTCHLASMSIFITNPITINSPKSVNGYLDITKYNNNLQNGYFRVSGFTEKIKYEHLFYASNPMDFIQCAFECQHLEVECQFFFYKVRTM